MFHELLVQYHIRPGIENTVFISDVSCVHKLQETLFPSSSSSSQMVSL
jgi:hypothetical protein